MGNLKNKIINVKVLLLFLLLLSGVSFSAEAKDLVNISGIVVDESGEPLIGVSVYQKGGQYVNGAITDIDGLFSINVERDSKVVFSYIGYQNFEYQAKKETSIKVILSEDNMALSEVVVSSGYNSYSSRSSNKKSSRSTKSSVTSYSGPTLPPPSTNTLSSNKAFVDIMPSANEKYGTYQENRFINPMDEALSTFSIDVDTESYTNFRRFINQGTRPNIDAIRIEEFINFFKYKYEEPTDSVPVKLTTEVGQCPWDEQNRLLKVAIKAKGMEKEDLPASNLVFLIDVSGSMYGANRLGLVQSSMKMLVNTLRPQDRVAIVVYASEVGQKLASTSGEEKALIIRNIELLHASGSTNGAGGLQKAYEIAQQNFIEGGNNRIILCSDGDFNVGMTSTDDLTRLVEEKRKSGVFLSVLGYGMGNYKSDIMQPLAEKGNGNAFYIDNIQEANRVLVKEFGSSLFNVAKDVKLQLEFNPTQVQAYRLLGYESRLLAKEDFNDDTKDAGEMGMGQTVTALYEIIPVGVESNKYPKVDELKYQKKISADSTPSIVLTNSPELVTVKLRYKNTESDTSIKLEQAVVDDKMTEESSDMRFASAVAMFGQLIKGSEYKGDATYQKVIELAKSGSDYDPEGYRAEFIRLVEAVANMNN